MNRSAEGGQKREEESGVSEGGKELCIFLLGHRYSVSAKWTGAVIREDADH